MVKLCISIQLKLPDAHMKTQHKFHPGSKIYTWAHLKTKQGQLKVLSCKLRYSLNPKL